MKKFLLVVLGIVFTIVLIYSAMIFSTNDIYKYVQQVIKGDIIITDDKDPLFYFSKRPEPEETAYSKYSFKRQDVFHNFKTGQMSVVYNKKSYDNNDKLIDQDVNIIYVFYIERQDGNWTVAKVRRIV